MKKPIQIGSKQFKYKKEALLFYKSILNSYDIGESLNKKDFECVSALVLKAKANDERVKTGINDIKIGKVQYGTKCFELMFNNEMQSNFSYINAINGRRTPMRKFIIACRNSIQSDLLNVKQKYFELNSKKGLVKCQESGKLSIWTELNVDHRQPNTFSIIVDRFIEINKIDVEEIDFIKDDENKIIFRDVNISEMFKSYHKEKANLRIVRKEINLGRSHQGRINEQKKDLRII